MRHMWRMVDKSRNFWAHKKAHEIGKEVKKLAEKHRYNLIMSMDDLVQREAWEILCKTKPGTRNKVVCNAIVKQDFMKSMREMLREELGKVSFVQGKEAEPTNDAINDPVIDFILQLQRSSDP